MGYNGYSKRLKNALMAIASALQYNGENAFGVVQGSNSGSGNGDPALQVLPGDLTTDHVTTNESDHIVSFILRIIMALEDEPASQAVVYDRMYDITDLVMDSLEVTDATASLEDELGTITVTVMNAARGDWIEFVSKSGASLVCDVNVHITYLKDLS